MNIAKQPFSRCKNMFSPSIDWCPLPESLRLEDLLSVQLEDPFVAYEYGKKLFQLLAFEKSQKKITFFFKVWREIFKIDESIPQQRNSPILQCPSLFYAHYQLLKVIHDIFKTLRSEEGNETLRTFLITWIQECIPSMSMFFDGLSSLPLYLSSMMMTVVMDIFKHPTTLCNTDSLSVLLVPKLHSQMLRTRSAALYRKYIKLCRKLKPAPPFLSLPVNVSSFIYSDTCDALVETIHEDQETQVTYFLLQLAQGNPSMFTLNEGLLAWLSVSDHHLIDFLSIYTNHFPGHSFVEVWNLACTTLFSSHHVILDFLLSSSTFVCSMLHVCKSVCPTGSVFTPKTILVLNDLIPCLSFLPYNANPLKKALEKAIGISMNAHRI